LNEVQERIFVQCERQSLDLRSLSEYHYSLP